jgi:hypothetical protein
MDPRKVLINTHITRMIKELDSMLEFSDGETKTYCEELFKKAFSNIMDDFASYYEAKQKKEEIAPVKDKDATIDKLIDILQTMKSPEAAPRRAVQASPLVKSKITKLGTLDDSGKKVDGRSENAYNKMTRFIKVNYNDCKENPLPKGKKLIAKDYSIIWGKIKTLTDEYDEEIWCAVIEEYIENRDNPKD